VQARVGAADERLDVETLVSASFVSHG